MTKTVNRKPLSQAMQLALWKMHGLVVCETCRHMCLHGEFDWDHGLALVDGGKHEVGEIGPKCKICHKIKSAREHKNNAKAKRNAKKHANPKPPGKIKSRGFDKTMTKQFNGRVVPRASAMAGNTGD